MIEIKEDSERITTLFSFIYNNYVELCTHCNGFRTETTIMVNDIKQKVFQFYCVEDKLFLASSYRLIEKCGGHMGLSYKCVFYIFSYLLDCFIDLFYKVILKGRECLCCFW